MVAAALPLAAGGVNAYAALSKAGSEADLSNWQAQQLRVNSGQVKASAQRDALNEDRNTALTLSRARAVAAVSGGGNDDPTIVNLMARLSQEGQYRSDVARYQGDSQARGMNMQADALDYQAKEAKQAGMLNAVSSVISGGASASMYSKYNDNPGGIGGGS